MNTALLLLGSNIEAEQNITNALDMLKRELTVTRVSSVWESEAVGSLGPPYLNVALLIQTELERDGLKAAILAPVEAALGRVRGKDKFADRTIDIDVIVFDGKIVDDELFAHAHIALATAELLPDLTNEYGNTIAQAASVLERTTTITRRVDLFALTGGKDMQTRLDYGTTAPDAISIFSKLEGYIIKSGLDRSLLELVKLRSSQINGCAFCIDMHTKDARARGESEQRLYGLNAWREAPYYSDVERAVLAWTEAVTNISAHQVSDDLYDEMRKHFSEKQLVDLTWAVVAINGWNRMAISFHTPAGSYMP
ncbi:MAG: 2-amino-4-hydroxy-6-hydroxymethyldihydropteridine diphosphokinase, partial [Sphaerochaeta sp.]|nr:2-amino-4-hydroxy-6-hydroxymethyldihydropteridine diphosphokinase [Sphaerochaeta sp.]